MRPEGIMGRAPLYREPLTIIATPIAAKIVLMNIEIIVSRRGARGSRRSNMLPLASQVGT
jgi:hypothetical protein